ncbi:hypothetical protein Vafri_2859 [Volvox africanus]|uniref:Uncharacterized protein n=1 Tax=Volvox africanus TaxID=51714 RepID=A0A8J4AQN4_9CHLO|nr:hypothetical protein Vafri_2859 [Volvox africanus]
MKCATVPSNAHSSACSFTPAGVAVISLDQGTGRDRPGIRPSRKACGNAHFSIHQLSDSGMGAAIPSESEMTKLRNCKAGTAVKLKDGEWDQTRNQSFCTGHAATATDQLLTGCRAEDREEEQGTAELAAPLRPHQSYCSRSRFSVLAVTCSAADISTFRCRHTAIATIGPSSSCSRSDNIWMCTANAVRPRRSRNGGGEEFKPPVAPLTTLPVAVGDRRPPPPPFPTLLSCSASRFFAWPLGCLSWA